MKDEDRQLDPTDIDWEGVALKCHSQYEVLGLVLSILGRAPPEATRRSHHLPLLILCVKFIILVAGESPKNSAPTLVSIMFTEDDGNFKVQVACSPPERADQEVRLGESAAKDRPDLNVVMGTTILHGGKDISRKKFQKLRGLIKHVRCDILENKCGYRLPGKDVARKVCAFPTHAIPVSGFHLEVIRVPPSLNKLRPPPLLPQHRVQLLG